LGTLTSQLFVGRIPLIALFIPHLIEKAAREAPGKHNH
jgi:hypothetical protein